MSSVSRPDPYRIFFPLGIILGLGGVLIWPLFYAGILSGYWGLSHAFLQSNGFLFCFIAGFLLTAVPRFTRTSTPSLTEQCMLAAVLIIGAIALEVQNYPIAHTAFAAAYLYLLILVFQRFRNRHGRPPETFSLIGIALLTGTLGAIINALVAWGYLEGNWGMIGKRSLTEGMTLMLVLGVGGFLGVRLLGFDKFSLVQIEGAKLSAKNWLTSRLAYAFAGSIILISIMTEYGLGWEWMSFVRAAIASLVILTTVQPFRLPVVRTTLSWCVWVANLFTIIAIWLVALFPIYRVDFLHVLFIGGFTLLILAVGMRVTLSHGGHGVTSEQKNWPLRIGLATGLIAMVARTGAPFSPNSMSSHLLYAAILWLIELGIWGWRLIRLIFQQKPETETKGAGYGRMPGKGIKSETAIG